MFLTVVCIFLTHSATSARSLMEAQAGVVLPSCTSRDDARLPIGCYNTDEALLTPAATFTYVSGYVSTYKPGYVNTLERYCGLQCLALRKPYYVLYNDSTCACVTVAGSLTLTPSAKCLARCQSSSVPGSQYCPTATPSLGAYWFCTPKSRCNQADVFNGKDVGFHRCNKLHLDDRIEGDYISGFCKTETDCLQQTVLYKCVNGSWNSLGQSSTVVCLPCSQSPTVCSPILACNPNIPPGTCVPASTTQTMTSAPATITTQLWEAIDSNSNNNPPWSGGKLNPLPSSKIYTLINTTNYDSSDRPTDPKDPAKVTTVSMSITIQAIDSVSELTSSFGLDMFFYLSWMDPRLNFNNIAAVGPPGSFFQLTDVREQEKLWIPPVYVGNKKATPNIDQSKHTTVLFLNSNGQASVVFRTFVTAECKMKLQDYPFDTQVCPIYLSLFGFYDHQVQLNWSVPFLFNMTNPSKPFSLNEKITLSAWTIVDYYTTTPDQTTKTNAVCTKFQTCLLAKIVLRRKASFYIIDTFLPNIIIMVGSCLTLWINPENVPARISMAVTLFLTFHAASLNVRSKLPSVTYVKAIDIWLFFGQGCLFCVMAEFLLLHTILNGYIKVPDWRIFALFRARKTAVQSEDMYNDRLQSGILGRKQTAKNIEKIARVLFPVVMILFAIIYFSVYLTA